MNQHQRPAEDVQGTFAGHTPDSSSENKAPRFALRLEAPIGQHGDHYGQSKATLLVWALTEYKHSLYGHLIKALKEEGEESVVDAGAFLHNLVLCDEMLTQLALDLHDIAAENAETIWASTNPNRKSTAAARFEGEYTDKITKILNRP